MSLFAKLLRWLLELLDSRKGKIRSSSSSTTESSMTGKFEVERKYPLEPAEHEVFPERLKRIGFSERATLTITDTFLPPDEAFDLMRIREQKNSSSKEYRLTAKKWVSVGDSQERKEFESTIDAVTRECILSLARRVAEQELDSYVKIRTEFSGSLDGYPVSVVLDTARGLGDYSGHYFEVEVVVATASETEAARAIVEKLVDILLKGEKRKAAPSYGEMLRLSKKTSSE